MTSHAIYQVKATALNLRAAPATNAAVVAVMPRDSLVSVIEGPDAEGWLRVVWNAFSGFAAGNPLRQMGDINFYVASKLYGCVEVAHLALLHGMLDILPDHVDGNPASGSGAHQGDRVVDLVE